MSDSSDLTPVTHLPVPDAAHPAWSESACSIQARAAIAWAGIDLRPDCPPGQGSGRARLVTDGVITMGRCRCQKLPDRIQIFSRAGLPARFAEATFVSFAQEPDGSLKDLDPL